MGTEELPSPKSFKSKPMATTLALLLGTLGIHRFYLKQYIRGAIYALFCWTYLPTVIGIFDAIYYALMKPGKFDALYNGIPLPESMTHCAHCHKKLTFSNRPILGLGKLDDGGRLCYKCYVKENAKNPNQSFKGFGGNLNEDAIDENKRALNGQFTEEFYHLLRYFAKNTLPLAGKLQTDKVLYERLKDFPLTNSTLSEFINGCMVWDMVKSLHVMLGDTFRKQSIEGTAMSLLIIPLLPNKFSPSLQDPLQVLVSAHKRGTFNELAKQLFNVGHEINPISLDMRTSDNKLIKNDFALPALLKLIDCPLFDEYASHLYRFASIVSKADGQVTDHEVEKLKYIYQQTHDPLDEGLDVNTREVINNSGSLNEVMDELNGLIGLEAVKAEVSSLVNFIRIQKARKDSGLKSSALSYHIVFTGNPGTGKTTVARIVAKIYKHLGILTQGHLVETDRSGLIAEYTGQTAIKVNRTVDSALNGVLFIDEAYSLVSENKDDFGKEAVATLIKRMEDDREKLVLILAGYSDEMESFIHTNPGLKSRFNRYIHFPDYSPAEMLAILKSFCNKLDYKLTPSSEEKLQRLFHNAYAHRDKTFGNGRYVRNVFEKMQENQANRIAKERVLNVEVLSSIIDGDIPD